MFVGTRRQNPHNAVQLLYMASGCWYVRDIDGRQLRHIEHAGRRSPVIIPKMMATVIDRYGYFSLIRSCSRITTER